MFFSAMVVSGLGFLVSLYGFFVEKRIERNAFYKPWCDISGAISCTKPLKSAYGKICGVSNALLGMVFYGITFALAMFCAPTALFYCSLAAVIASGYLAYILYTKIQSFCLICTTIYVINIVLLLVSRHLI